MAADLTIAEAARIVDAGEIDPNVIHVPSARDRVAPMPAEGNA